MSKNVNENLSRLMQQQNLLLERQNQLLEQLAVGRQPLPSNGGGYVEDIDHDEMRSGYIVTSHRKKLWNAQIAMIKEFDRICRKYNLRWFADSGTLLGAVRHGGFIPWDDDVDVVMFRPDYMKFQSVIEDELKDHPYYSVWQWFNYRLETDEPSDQTDMSLPLVSKEQQYKYPLWAPFFPIIKIMDDRTTAVNPDDRKNVYRSVFLDVFPLDMCPPFEDQKTATVFEMNRELLAATVLSEALKEAVESGAELLLQREDLLKILRLPYKQRARLFERTAAENFFQTPYVGYINKFLRPMKAYSLNAKIYEDVVYLPFEKIEVPAPKGYEEYLSTVYGDWHKFVINHQHLREWSTEIPYAEYLRANQLEKQSKET